MGRPINKRFFGDAGIDVVYNDGLGSAAGVIVKQTGTRTFVIADNSSADEVECTLVWKDADTPATPTSGKFSIAVPGTGTFVKKITAHKIVDDEGTVFTWNATGTGVDKDLTP